MLHLPLTAAAQRRIAGLAISETGFVFDPRSGLSFSANATAITALRELQRGASAAAITNALREQFEVGPTQVDDHLTEFLALLTEFGLLPAAAGKTPGQPT